MNFPGSSNTQTQKTMGIVMTQQGDAVAGELATEKVGIKGYLAFFLTIIFFPVFFPGQTVGGAFLIFPF